MAIAMTTSKKSSDLRVAVEGLHDCEALFAYEIDITERFNDEVVWEGSVSVFDLEGHPSASECYAWSEPVKGSDKRRFFAVLKVSPVDSPEAAVRASIMSDHKTAQNH